MFIRLLLILFVLLQTTNNAWSQAGSQIVGNREQYMESMSSIQIVPGMFSGGPNNNPFGLNGPAFFPAFLSPFSFINFVNSLMNTNSIILPFAMNQPYCNQQLINDNEYMQCRANAAQYWTSYANYGNYGSYSGTTSSVNNANFNQMVQQDTKYACCYFWAVVYCTQNAVYRLCDNNALNYFYTKQNELYANLESKYSLCYYYSHNSFTCRTTFWIIIIVCSIIGLLLLILGIVLGWMYYKRRNRSEGSDTDSEVNVTTQTRPMKMYSQRANDPMPNRSSMSPNNNPDIRTKTTAIDDDDDPNMDRYDPINNPNNSNKYFQQQYKRSTSACSDI